MNTFHQLVRPPSRASITRLDLIVALAALLLAGCQELGVGPTAAGERTGRLIAVSGRQFLDGQGQPLLLHGINIINKSKAEGYTARIERADFAAIHGWGMNCVRLGILWDGLEPQPGQFDEGYLDRIARIVAWAKAEGLYVLLDMHQDLFSVKFSDGAPAWATLDEGQPYQPTTVWSDAYYTSPAVQAALDHFWANHPGPDGIGLQDHYARAWQHLAERFKDEPAVLGFDLMNEPFPGRDAMRTQQSALTALASRLGPRLGITPPQLFALMGTPAGRRQITEWMGNIDDFRAMLAASAPIMQGFERDRLMPMYTRVSRAIRQVDARHIIFLEPAMSANLGIPSALAPLVDAQERRDPQQAYAPHGYDIVTDTALLGLNSDARIELIFSQHEQTARRLDMPMLVGEWGAYYENPAAAQAAAFVVQQFDILGCGDIYWAYRRSFGSSPLRLAVERHPK